MPAGSTLLDIVERLGIPKGMWALACIRGELIPPEKPLEGEAEISLFPPVSGG
jgi:sulfur carrier protein ThiS